MHPNVTQFADRAHTQQGIAEWRIDYKKARPFGAVGQLTPRKLAALCQVEHPREAV
ncbi:hypothetical protein [Gemmatimonas sp. UBA7669]|uniref:hypothetical protein n=1 Tax=Gemmatimonas sp. UBA7669 TaxID=1946568 RepID=UPI0039C8B907